MILMEPVPGRAGTVVGSGAFPEDPGFEHRSTPGAHTLLFTRAAVTQHHDQHRKPSSSGATVLVSSTKSRRAGCACRATSQQHDPLAGRSSATTQRPIGRPTSLIILVDRPADSSKGANRPEGRFRVATLSTVLRFFTPLRTGLRCRVTLESFGDRHGRFIDCDSRHWEFKVSQAQDDAITCQCGPVPHQPSMPGNFERSVRPRP
jgi:hypothetical protein